MKIIVATNNSHKLDEIRKILPDGIEAVSLREIGCLDDIPETGTTLEENAMIKARHVFGKYGQTVIADDTGLEVDALGGAPGVYSARYAGGEGHDSEANMTRLLGELHGRSDRTARFRTVIAYIEPAADGGAPTERLFEGTVEGVIATERRGSGGFGYDPIFMPDGYGKSFAELGPDVKNRISHRARALGKFAGYIESRFPDRTSGTLKTIIAMALLALTALPAAADAIGTWKNYLAYHELQRARKAGSHIFVQASDALFQISTADNSVWTYDKTNGMSDINIKLTEWNARSKRLLAVYRNSNMDLIDTGGNITNMPELLNKTMTEDKSVNHIHMHGEYAFLSTNFGMVKLNTLKEEVSETYILGMAVKKSTVRDNTIYIIDSNRQIYRADMRDNLLDRKNWKPHTGDIAELHDNSDRETEELRQTVAAANPGGPKYNYTGFLKMAGGKLLTCNGERDNENKAALQILHDGEWTVCNDDIESQTGHRFLSLMFADADPKNPGHIIAGGQTGVYEFDNGKLTAHYNFDNSPLLSALGDNKDYTICSGGCYDKGGNVWLFNAMVRSEGLFEIKSGSGSLTSHFDRETLTKDGYSFAHVKSMFEDSRGLIVMANNHWVTPALAFYRKNMQGDEQEKYTVVKTFVNQDGTSNAVNRVTCAEEDKEGNIWIGTDVGPLYISSADMQAIAASAAAAPTLIQHKVPRNDGTNFADYLLANVYITAIAIDGGNRKWFGTASNGVYLVSGDNNTEIHHFTKDNSPLISDNILDIEIDQDKGTVYIGTNEGLCSYASDATTSYEEMDKDNVYAYPNPVTPDYNGPITVVGLSYDADVKIATATGSIVRQGRSNGGTFTWDGTDMKGNRVVSGVYNVMTAKSDGTKGTVCKIAIVR